MKSPLNPLRIIFLLFPVFTFSQNILTATIIDAHTRSPLAFANVKSDDGAVTVTSDLYGKFTLKTQKPLSGISCSYIGYTTKHLSAAQLGKKPLVIALTPAQNELSEVVVSNVNPANAIMRKVIANKKRNNPENLESFQYNCYNKFVLNTLTTDTVHVKIPKGYNAFMLESVTKRKYLKPDYSEEEVLATKVSGFRNPAFAAVMTDFQPFSFYKDDIKLLDRHYLNPISNGSLSKYRFTLEETRAGEKDTVYVISFKPQANKNFDALKGLLYINTNGYAVQNVVAAPAEKKKIELRIRQQYQYTDGQWFPEQMNFALVFNEYPDPKMSMVFDGKSYIDSVSINPSLRRRDFGLQAVRINSDAAKKDSVYWNSFRKEPLTRADLKTYHQLDSIAVVHHTDRTLGYIVNLFRGRLPVGPLDIDLTRILGYNKYEGLRLGAGLYTNDKLVKNLSFGGYYGYGFHDHHSKYGYGINYKVSQNHEFELGLEYRDDLSETGIPDTNLTGPTLSDYRQFIGYRYDRKQGASFSAAFRTFRYFKWKLSFNSDKVTPQYTYLFNHSDNPPFDYHNTTVNVNLRFAYKEKLLSSFGRIVSAGTPYPVLTVSYTGGLRNLLDGDYKYNSIEAQLSQSFFTKNTGTTSYTLQGGYVDQVLPYGLLFTGEGSYDKDFAIIMKNTFQTMRPYEFLSDRYLNVFLSHDFGSLLFKSGKFQPGISLHTNVGFANLEQPLSHMMEGLKVRNRAFLESGLQLDNLLKFNYLDIGNGGLGFAAYYRYGDYKYPDFGDNVVLKFSFAFTLK